MLMFIDTLDDALSPLELNNEVAGLFNKYPAIDDKLGLPGNFSNNRIGGVRPTLNAKEFKDQIRNIILLRPSTPPAQDGGTHPNR